MGNNHRKTWGGRHAPNTVTVSRAVLGAAAFPIFLDGGLDRVAFWLCCVAAALDWFDGWAARRLAQESALGGFLDPAADKLVMIVVYGVMAGRAGSWVIWSLFALLVARDVLLTGRRVREFLVSGSCTAADRVGKLKTCLQSLSGLGVLFYGIYIDERFTYSSPPVVFLFAGVAMLSWVSWVRYAGLGERVHVGAGEGRWVAKAASSVVGRADVGPSRSASRIAKGSVADQDRPTLTTVKPEGMAGSTPNLPGWNGIVKRTEPFYDIGGAVTWKR